MRLVLCCLRCEGWGGLFAQKAHSLFRPSRPPQRKHQLRADLSASTAFIPVRFALRRVRRPVRSKSLFALQATPPFATQTQVSCSLNITNGSCLNPMQGVGLPAACRANELFERTGCREINADNEAAVITTGSPAPTMVRPEPISGYQCHQRSDQNSQHCHPATRCQQPVDM